MPNLEQISKRYGIQLINQEYVTVPDWDLVLSLSQDFRDLSTKETTSRWHQEKNMLEHTKMVCDKMREYANSDPHLYGDLRLILMLSAMFHDLGKCRCQNSEDGRLLSNGHPLISEKLCRLHLWDLEVVDRERICEIVRWHDLYCSSDISDRKLKTKIGQLSMWLFVHTDMLFKMFLADDHGSLKPVELEGGAQKMVNRIESLLKTEKFHTIPNSKGKGISKEFEIYVMCGLPGSGKSTWCSENLKGLPVISRDTIREELGMTEKGVKFMGTPEQEDLVSKISDERALEYCKAGQSFVYDNMNSRERYRRSFYDKVKKFKPIMRYVYLEVTDLSVLEARRPEIASKGPVVYKTMIEKMEFPRPDEYDTIEVFQNLSVTEETFRDSLMGVLHL